MDGYRIVIDLTNVTEGDVTGLAQRIWDEEAEGFDAKLDEFKMHILNVQGGAQFESGWTPQE